MSAPPKHAFKIGDKVILHNCVTYPKFNGLHAMVVSELMYHTWTGSDGKSRSGDVYYVECADHRVVFVRPNQLRKKPAPRKKKVAKDFAVLSSWELVGWSPKKVSA